MKDPLQNINVVVKGNSDNTITITRDIRPTHNTARVAHKPEIVVSYFTDEDLERFHDIYVEYVSGSKHEIKDFWEKCISHVIHKNKK